MAQMRTELDEKLQEVLGNYSTQMMVGRRPREKRGLGRWSQVLSASSRVSRVV